MLTNRELAEAYWGIGSPTAEFAEGHQETVNGLRRIEAAVIRGVLARLEAVSSLTIGDAWWSHPYDPEEDDDVRAERVRRALIAALSPEPSNGQLATAPKLSGDMTPALLTDEQLRDAFPLHAGWTIDERRAVARAQLRRFQCPGSESNQRHEDFQS